MMMLIVSGVGALIVAYSIGYMDGDDEERRYFAYMSLFVFSMLLLVQAATCCSCSPAGAWSASRRTC
jgi:NADH-quinone oxidoreductase subunit L